MPEPSRRPAIVSRVIAVEGGLIALAWVLAWGLDRPLIELIVFDWEGIVAGLLATVPLYAAMVWSTRTSMPPFPQVRRDVLRLIVPMLRGVTVWQMLLIAVLAGVGEELFFRGLLQPGLGDWVGVWPALILTSALFGALHWITPTYALLAGLIGLYLGGFMAVSGNLIVPILVHALYDFFALRYLVGLGRGLPQEESGAAGAGGNEPDTAGEERKQTAGPGNGGLAAPGPPDPT